MNRIVTHVMENALALAFYLARLRKTPNPFRPLDENARAQLAVKPEDFYAIPTAPPALVFRGDHVDGEALRGRFTFPSSYRSRYPENNVVHGLADIRRRGKARAALVIIHGHTMGSLRLLEWYARPAVRMGMDVYYLSLPYHLKRAPKGTWSGQYSLNADVYGSAVAFMQGVRDLRSLISWIEAERRAPVVLAGLSLGAFTSLMTSVVDDRPKAVISLLGGGSLAQIIWDGYQLNRSKSQLRAGGVSGEELERYWAACGPGNWKPKIAKEQVLMMAGKYDPIVTPANVERLWEAWDHPALHWYPCGHATILHYHQPVREEIFRFLAGRI